MSGDDLNATLNEAKRIADALQFACRIPDKVPNFAGAGGPAAEQYWEYFHPARVISLLAALDEALKRHRPSAQRCILDDFSWPCPTVEAITRALTGKEASGA